MSDATTPPGGTSADGVTELLLRWTGGDGAALDLLMPARLRRAEEDRQRVDAARARRPHPAAHGARARGVDAHVRQDRVSFEHRKQFFGLAAQVMRRILVDHARAARAGKRGGGAEPASLDAVTIATEDKAFDLLALDHALTELSRVDPRQAQVIELRYFGGLTIDELAETLGCRPAPSAATSVPPRRG